MSEMYDEDQPWHLTQEPEVQPPYEELADHIEALEAEKARLTELLNTIETLTATGDGLGPDEVITIHCLASRAALQDKGKQND